MADQLVEVTDRLVEQAKTPAGSWTRAQLAIIGVAWPPKQGWRKRLEGKWITKKDADLFVQLGRGRNSGNYRPSSFDALMDSLTAIQSGLADDGYPEDHPLAIEAEKAVALAVASKKQMAAK